jgi:hypothetical protein
VTESQRNRIHQAMIEVVSERGYPETRAVDGVGVAGVSRKTFYELFDSNDPQNRRRQRLGHVVHPQDRQKIRLQGQEGQRPLGQMPRRQAPGARHGDLQRRHQGLR